MNNKHLKFSLSLLIYGKREFSIFIRQKNSNSTKQTAPKPYRNQKSTIVFPFKFPHVFNQAFCCPKAEYDSSKAD